MDVARDAYATGFGQRLHSCRHVDAVAVQIAAFDDYVAEADTDTQRELLALGNMCVARCKSALDFDGALDCIDRAGELD